MYLFRYWFKIFVIKKINLFILTALGLLLLNTAFSCGEQGLLLGCSVWVFNVMASLAAR